MQRHRCCIDAWMNIWIWFEMKCLVIEEIEWFEGERVILMEIDKWHLCVMGKRLYSIGSTRNKGYQSPDSPASIRPHSVFLEVEEWKLFVYGYMIAAAICGIYI